MSGSSKKLFYLILITSLVLGALSGCVNDWVKEESDKNISAFYFTKEQNPHFAHNDSLSSQRYDGVIEGTTITVFMPEFVSNRTNLKANFVTTAETIKVNNTTQRDGESANNFSFSRVVSYKAIAEDGSVKEYSVRVNSPPDMDVKYFRLLKAVNPCLTQDVEGALNSEKNEIYIHRKQMDADCDVITPNFDLSLGAYFKVNGVRQQSGVSGVNFENLEFMPYTFVAADRKTVDWKVYLSALNDDVEIKEFYLPYENGNYKQTFEGFVNYPDIMVYLNDEISMQSISSFASDPVIKVSDKASYEVKKVFEGQAESMTLYKVKVTSSTENTVREYNVKFSYKSPSILSFKIQPEPAIGKSNGIEEEVPGYIYETLDDEGNFFNSNSIHLKFPLGEEIGSVYVPTFSFTGYKALSVSAYGTDNSLMNLDVVNRQTSIAFTSPLMLRLYSKDEVNPIYVDYEIKIDNQAPMLAGDNTLTTQAEETEGAYVVLYVEPSSYYKCKSVPELNNNSRCGDATEDADIIAYDNITDYNQLQCGLFYSRFDNINTLEEIKENGSLLGDYYSFSAPDYDISQSDENLEYIIPNEKCKFRIKQISSGNIYFNMVIKDRAGHEIAFANKSSKIILNDYAPPKISDDRLSIVPTALNGKSDLQWLSAYDENDNLEYAVYYSRYNNINTESKIEANGEFVEEFRAFVCDDQGVCSYELPTLIYAACSESCYLNVMVKDTSGNKEIYGSVKFITDYFEGQLEEEKEFWPSQFSDSSEVGGYFTYMDTEKAFLKNSDDEDYLIFPLGVRMFRAGEPQNAWKSGEHTFQVLNVALDGNISIDRHSANFKKDLFPLSLYQSSPEKSDGFAKIHMGIFQISSPVNPSSMVESAVLLVGDKLNRYNKLRMVDIRPNINCEVTECVRDNMEIMSNGVAEPLKDGYHYMDNGPLLQLSNGNLFLSHTIQEETNNRNWRRHILKIYEVSKQDWKEIGLEQFPEVQNYSLNAESSSNNLAFYGTEIHPAPPTANTFNTVNKQGNVKTGVIVVQAEGSFTFSETRQNGESQSYSYYTPLHQHTLTIKLFSDEGILTKEEKLETGVIANQYSSITKLNDGNVMIVYAVSEFNDDGNNWFQVKTDIKLSVYNPYDNTFVVKNKIIKTIEKNFTKPGNSNDRAMALVNPITQGGFAELVPGGVSSVALGGKVMIAYRDPGDNNKGKFVVCNNKGELISDEIIFSEEPVVNDIYYIRDPLYSFESFSSHFYTEQEAIDTYNETAYQRTNFARITLGAFKNNKALISFIPDRDSANTGYEKAKVVIVR